MSDDEEIDYSVKPEFYDPELDDKDELWVHNKRKGRNSDAVLCCPACFTTLSLDCQRYIYYLWIYVCVPLWIYVFRCDSYKGLQRDRFIGYFLSYGTFNIGVLRT